MHSFNQGCPTINELINTCATKWNRSYFWEWPFGGLMTLIKNELRNLIQMIGTEANVKTVKKLFTFSTFKNN